MLRDTKRRMWGVVGVAVLLGLSVWIAGPWHPTIQWGALERDLNVKLGLDLQGGAHLIYRANVEQAQTGDPAEAIAGVRDVIERRVNAFGVSEPVVQTNRVGDEYRVIVELAGVHDTELAIDLIGETPQLDFRVEKEEGLTIPENVDEAEGGIVGPLFDPTPLTGKHLSRALVEFDQFSGTPQVTLEFNGEGTELFANITRENLGKRVAIYLDGVPISAPVVQAEITNGKAVITGGFTLEEAKQLARRLNAGALPVPIELIGQAQIGPSLGERSIAQSIRAGLVGLVAVMAWMIFYYRLPGLVSAVALVMYAVFFLALIKLIPVTLTVAGIAGFILTVGMAVDANVLIFERLRENLRDGKTIGYSMRNGFIEAWESIQASNISSLLTAAVLYGFGSSIVRGFALTFALGTMLSMFTAITITRGILSWLLTKQWTHKSWLLGVKSLKSGI